MIHCIINAGVCKQEQCAICVPYMIVYAALSLYVRVAREPTHRINSWLPMRMNQESDILAFADCLAFSIGIPVMFIACYLGREVHMRYWN